jgi:phage recombination protein Bet
MTATLLAAKEQDSDLLHVLHAAVYPNASPEALGLIVSYCKAAGLDPLQKPLQIIQVADSHSGLPRWAVVPGIGLYRTIAARCGCAGIDEPEFGPDVTQSYGDQQVTFPSWCRVTVHRRLASGEIAHFTAREFWQENVALEGPAENALPNAMWSKRPHGQLAKCAEAQALRKAFPEIGSQPVAEELDGKAFGPAFPSLSRPPASSIHLPRARPDASVLPQGGPTSQELFTPAPPLPHPERPRRVAQNSAPATAGEIAYLRRKIDKIGLTITAAREQAALAPADNLDGLTGEEFARLQEALA